MNLVQLLALAGAVVFIVMLFAYRPGTSSASGGNTSVGARLFSASCARCHGAAGEGGIGPQLAGSVVRAFPDPQAEVEVVRRGRGAMPAFEGSLTYDEIQQVVNYTRSL